MKSTGETTNTTEKEQKLPVTEKNGTAPEKTEHILNRLIIGAGVCVAVIAVLIGVKLYRQAVSYTHLTLPTNSLV